MDKKPLSKLLSMQNALMDFYRTTPRWYRIVFIVIVLVVLASAILTGNDGKYVVVDSTRPLVESGKNTSIGQALTQVSPNVIFQYVVHDRESNTDNPAPDEMKSFITSWASSQGLSIADNVDIAQGQNFQFAAAITLASISNTSGSNDTRCVILFDQAVPATRYEYNDSFCSDGTSATDSFFGDGNGVQFIDTKGIDDFIILGSPGRRGGLLTIDYKQSGPYLYEPITDQAEVMGNWISYSSGSGTQQRGFVGGTVGSYFQDSADLIDSTTMVPMDCYYKQYNWDSEKHLLSYLPLKSALEEKRLCNGNSAYTADSQHPHVTLPDSYVPFGSDGKSGTDESFSIPDGWNLRQIPRLFVFSSDIDVDRSKEMKLTADICGASAMGEDREQQGIPRCNTENLLPNHILDIVMHDNRMVIRQPGNLDCAACTVERPRLTGITLKDGTTVEIDNFDIH